MINKTVFDQFVRSLRQWNKNNRTIFRMLNR
jgi:hypothetical protein